MTAHTFTYTEAERTESIAILDQLRKKVGDSFLPDDEELLRRHLLDTIANHQVHRNVFGLNPILCSLQTALIDQFGDPQFGRIANSLLGLTIFLAMLALCTFMLWRAHKHLRGRC